ncbi:hypothetical protein BS50DRAFT_589080 [Corynespora cassiicola Philippines]|uniref:Uncharacterized protein n=1 Tax=Corynespora cassiicola Philippines TaxID=1448308 RepID=A0A2T2NLL8_CORCC|nr:hypothetical protein BS50DRAFT_589080 [Corynespora cassiicola Philippines]
MASNVSSTYSSGESKYHIADQGDVRSRSVPTSHGFDLDGLKWALIEADESSGQTIKETSLCQTEGFQIKITVYTKNERTSLRAVIFTKSTVANACSASALSALRLTLPCAPQPLIVLSVLRLNMFYNNRIQNAEKDHGKTVKDMHNMLLWAVNLKAKFEQEQKTHQENLQKWELERANLVQHYQERAENVAKTHEQSVQALVADYSIRFQTLENQCKEKLENSAQGQVQQMACTPYDSYIASPNINTQCTSDSIILIWVLYGSISMSLVSHSVQ